MTIESFTAAMSALNVSGPALGEALRRGVHFAELRALATRVDKSIDDAQAALDALPMLERLIVERRLPVLPKMLADARTLAKIARETATQAELALRQMGEA